jgi:predicted phosphodiesterase
VCHGHTHRRREERVGKTLVLNPGAIYRANPHTFAIVDLPLLEVTSVVI